MKQQLLLIGGSTGVGKSKFALELSKSLKMEIISADSIQVYKDLNIGTSKPSTEESQICPHYLINIIDANQTFNAFDFVTYAKRTIDEIISRGNLPVIVGGTGLYMEALLYAYSFQKEKQTKSAVYDYSLYILNEDREELYTRINTRVDIMIKNGLVEEVKKLLSQGIDEKAQCMQAIGYKEIVSYLKNEMDLQSAIEKIKQGTRNYAKRQVTWFKHMDGKWFDIHTEWKQTITEIINKYKQFIK